MNIEEVAAAVVSKPMTEAEELLKSNWPNYILLKSGDPFMQLWVVGRLIVRVNDLGVVETAQEG